MKPTPVRIQRLAKAAAKRYAELHDMPDRKCPCAIVNQPLLAQLIEEVMRAENADLLEAIREIISANNGGMTRKIGAIARATMERYEPSNEIANSPVAPDVSAGGGE